MSHELVRHIDANPMPAMAILLVLMLLIWAIATSIRKRSKEKLGSTTSQSRQGQKGAERQLRESARVREEEARKELQQQELAKEEGQRQRQEFVMLPRLLGVLLILDRVNDFSLLKDSLRACDRIIQERNKQKLFRKYRRSLLSSAVRFACKENGTPRESVEADLKTILKHLCSSEHLNAMLLDFHRKVTLATAKANGRSDIEELEEAINALTARHAARVDAIQKSQLSADDKARLIEELETELSDAISKLLTG